MIGKDGRCLDNYLNWKTKEKIEELTKICKKIQSIGQHFMILKGGIAVGKTLFAKEISKRLVDEKRIHFFQLHEGYSYSNFLYGQQIQTDGGQIKYEKGSQPLLKIIKECETTSELHVVILDDMNRCNFSEVAGDLLSALESNEVGNIIKTDKDDVTLPNNLFFIGTMNTLVGKEVMDYAWFRRFTVVELKADSSYFEVDKNKNESEDYELYKWYAKQIFEHVRMLFERYFSDYENKAEMEKYVIGQGMFLQCENKDLAKDLDVLHLRLKYIIAPLLLEYVSNGVLCDYIRNDIIPLTNMWGDDLLLELCGEDDIGLNETIKKIIEDKDLPSNIKYFFFLHGNNIMFNIGMKIEDRMVCNMLIEYSDYVKENPNLVYARGSKNKGQPTESIYSEKNIIKIDNIDYWWVTATLLAQMKLYNGKKWERCTPKYNLKMLNEELSNRFGNEKKKFKKIKEIMRI